MAFLVGHQDTIFFAAIADDVLACVYGEDYSWDASADERAEHRKEIAVKAASRAQGVAALIALDAGAFDPDVESEDILTAIFGSREFPAPDLAWEWTRGETLPLIITSASVELRRRPFPTGPGVKILDSRSSIRLIHSLANLGVFELVRL